MNFLTVSNLAVNSLCLGVILLPGALLGLEPCRIEVVEKGSGWPVPLVEFRTTHNVRLVTDNAGVIAFALPELMGRETWSYAKIKPPLDAYEWSLCVWNSATTTTRFTIRRQHLRGSPCGARTAVSV